MYVFNDGYNGVGIGLLLPDSRPILKTVRASLAIISESALPTGTDKDNDIMTQNPWSTKSLISVNDEWYKYHSRIIVQPMITPILPLKR